MEKSIGTPCSTNFKFKKRIENVCELYEILETKKSIFWNHRMFPTAVIMQQKLTTINVALKYGHFWDVDPITQKIK